LLIYSSDSGAPTGQTPLQVPHPIQAFGSISYLPLPSVMQDTGQAAAQAPQAIHLSVILYAIIVTTFQFFSLLFLFYSYFLTLMFFLVFLIFPYFSLHFLLFFSIFFI
jgi:hypothetical protein